MQPLKSSKSTIPITDNSYHSDWGLQSSKKPFPRVKSLNWHWF
jgi:hypothetical protein